MSVSGLSREFLGFKFQSAAAAACFGRGIPWHGALMANSAARTASHAPAPLRQQPSGPVFTSARIDWPIEWPCFDPLSHPLGSPAARLGFITTRSRHSLDWSRQKYSRLVGFCYTDMFGETEYGDIWAKPTMQPIQPGVVLGREELQWQLAENLVVICCDCWLFITPWAL